LGFPVVPEVNMMSLTSSVAGARQVLLLRVATREEAGPARVPPGVAAKHHDLLQVRRGRPGLAQGRRIVEAQEGAHGEEHPGSAPGEDVRRLRAAEAGVQRDQHRADHLQSQGGDHPFVDIGRPDRDPIALGDAARPEGPGRAAGRLRQLGIGQARVAVDEGFLRPKARAVAHQVGRTTPFDARRGISHLVQSA
jgi:hypothetical protein